MKTNYILTSTSIYKIIHIINSQASGTPRFKRLSRFNDSYIIKIHHGGSREYIIDLRKKLFLPLYYKIQETMLDRLSMKVNSERPNQPVEIRQLGWDRIITFKFPDEAELVTELFSGGNMIYVDSSRRIVDAYREFETKKRRVLRGEIYEPPTTDIDSVLREKDIVKKKELFRILPFDPMTIEEKFGEKEEYSVEEVIKTIHVIERNVKEALNDPRFFLYEFRDKVYIQPYQMSIGTLYNTYTLEEMAREIVPAILKPDSRIDEINREIERLKTRIEDLKHKKKSVYEALNKLYGIVHHLSEIFSMAQENTLTIPSEFNGIKVMNIDRKDREVEILVDGEPLRLRYDLNVYASISKAFDNIKKLDMAIENITREIRELERKKEAEETKTEIHKLKLVLRKKWFEKFIWSYSRNGFLIVAGKDATTNEVIVKKHLEDEDLVFHAEIKGSPFTILKKGKAAGHDDIIDAAIITASYSSAWKHGLTYVPVYYVEKKQVSKKAPSGQFLQKGSFMIYGEKRYVRDLELTLYISLLELEGEPRIFIGSREAVKNRCGEPFFKLTPKGRLTRGEAARKIVTTLVEKGYIGSEYEEIMYNDLVNRLPAGTIHLTRLI